MKVLSSNFIILYETPLSGIKKLKFLLQSSCSGNVWFDDLKIVKMADGMGQGNREQNITYDGFKNPLEIYEKDVDHISFIYNDAHSRSDMFYGGTGDDKMQRQYRKHYSADGTMEVKYNTSTQSVEFITYLGGDAYSAPVAAISYGSSTQNYLYLHRDYQGSILAITNEAGAVVERRLFDAWGNILKVQDGAGNNLYGLTILDRGYTGHEHLQSVGLINMNARLYDPLLHRFLQPDNYVQDPYNTQNYNRYGYVLNNPTKYTDPDGEWVTQVIGALVGAYIGGAQTNGTFNIFKWNFKDSDTWKGIGIGAVVGALGGAMISQGVSFAIGSQAIGFAGLDVAGGAVMNYVGGAALATGLGYSIYDSLKSSKNGVKEKAPVVKPKSDTNGGDKDKEDDSFHPGQLLPNFKSDIGFDVLKFKGLHYGVPEFESSWMTGGAITPGPFVIYPTGGSSMETYNTHEGGHFVQFLALRGAYYPLIGVPSIINTQLHWKIFDYTEKTANDLWYWWSGESSNLNQGYIKR